MKTLITLVVVLSCLQLWAQVPDTTSVAPGRLIIKVNQAFQTIGTRSDGIIETDQTWFNNLAVQYQIDVLRKMYVGSTRAYQQNKYLICFPDSIDLETVVSSFDLQSSVQNVRYDFYVHLCTDDPFNSYQWNLQRINANAGYYTIAGSIQAPQAVRIAVVDTGIDYNHPDLFNSVLRDQNNNVIGTNLVFPGQPAMDDNGHGTLVAGVIAARTNNNAGISSLVTGDNVKLMPIKAFAQDRIGFLSDVCEGIQWAIDQDANVINCSWVVYSYDVQAYELSDVIDDNGDVLFVAARGNYGATYPGYWSPTRTNVIAVGGSSINNRSEYNGESWVSVCAPSGSQFLWDGAHDNNNGIVSTLPVNNSLDPYKMHYSQNQSPSDPYYSFQCGAWQVSTNYDYLKGTSLSAAHVSGLIGMLWAKYYTALSNETMDLQDIRDILVKSAQDFNTNDYNVYNGWGSGIINAQEALMTPHPNLSLRQYWIGTSAYSYPLSDNTLTWNLPSIEWGSSQSIRLQIRNKWVAGTSVQVRLSSTDTDLSFSYPGESDRYSVGNIAAETTIVTNNMWVRDNSNQVRNNVPITITIRANGMPDRVYTIFINISQSSYAVVGSINMLQDETITTDLIASNLYTSNDDLLVGTSAGRLFCFRDNQWIHVGTLPQGIVVNPAIGDIDADGRKEIVVIDSAGNISVYSGNLSLLRTYQCFSNETTVGSIVLEDITGDDIIDIVYSTNRTGSSTQNAGVRIVDYANNAAYAYLTDMDILAAIAVGDVDHNRKYEIVVPYSDSTTGSFRFKVLRFENSDIVVTLDKQLSSSVVTYALPPIIVDMNEDGLREVAWIIGDTIGNSHMFYYSVLDDEVIYSSSLLETTVFNNEVAKLSGLTSGLASLSTRMVYAPLEQFNVRIENGMVFSPDWEFVSIPMDSRVKCILADELFPSINGLYSQQIVLMTDHEIKIYRFLYNQANPNEFSFEEMWEYKTNYGMNVELKSIASANYDIYRMLYAITDDGILYKYSFTNSTETKSECPQRRQNSRHTGCYEQPIPKEIREDLEIKHPAVFSNDAVAYSSVIDISEGVVGRFENSINFSLNRSALNVFGSGDNPVLIKSMGGGLGDDYWKGIYINNGSTLNLNWAEVSGAQQALELSNTGYRIIQNSKFHNNIQNIKCYNATVNLYNNYLTDAIHAISAYHFSNPMLNSSVALQNGLNEISGNEFGIFSDSSTPYLNNGHNNLENVTYNLYLQNSILNSREIVARYNWWGSDDYDVVRDTIYPLDKVLFAPYDLQPNQTIMRENQTIDLFIEGYSFMMDGNYPEAISCFNAVLTDSLINESDVVSLYALFECNKLTNNTMQFETQLDQYINNEDFLSLHKVMKNVRALIFRETERYSQAIDFYESILTNNPSFQDSCYAVIDIGDTYFESNKRVRGQFSRYIPTSINLHQQNKGILLSKISRLQGYENTALVAPHIQLLGNYPNPFNPSTTIAFSIPSEMPCRLDVYNLRGQKVRSLVNETVMAGNHSIVWNGKDDSGKSVSSGVYFYRLSTPNKIQTSKMLLMK